jgi:UDP-glucose 4-epimerase
MDEKKPLVVVTGGAGFVGSNLCARLLADGCRVVAIDNLFAGSEQALPPGVEFRQGHTKDIASLVPEIPQLVYHLGEYARVEQSLEEDPSLVWDLNTAGTFAVVEFCRSRKVKLVYAGSSTKFGDDGKARDATPYGWTKATNTELVRNYGSWFGMSYAITYFYNVFGNNERSGRYGTLIAIFKEMYRSGGPLTVTAPGTQERNFTHVDDIVDGLMLVGKHGQGDGYALGNEKAYTILEVARLFGRDIVMLPERRGNRLTSVLDTTKSRALGWEAKRSLEDDIHVFLEKEEGVRPLGSRVLVFTTAFHPVSGPAEESLCDVMRAMPFVHFDIVTAKLASETTESLCPVPNATVYHVGMGNRFDKFLLPFLGAYKASQLHREYRYTFAWSLMASYAALAALLLKKVTGLPLLVTLADQDITTSTVTRGILRFILRQADQVYASTPLQGRAAQVLSRMTKLRTTMGDGDAFANQLRFVYGQFLNKRLQKQLP